MEKSPQEVLWKLLRSKRETIDKLNELLENRVNLNKSIFDSEHERLERTLYAINAHIVDAQLLIQSTNSDNSILYDTKD